jgi:DNA-binding MarR family transcriptional regulator
MLTPSLRAVPKPARPSLASRMHRLEMAVNQAVFDRLSEGDFQGIRPSHISFVDQMGNGCRMNEMARRLSLTPGAVTQIADQMEHLGLVSREMDPSDRRAVIVRPTEKVRGVWAQARRIVDQVEAGWARTLGPDRFRALESMIDQLLQTGK